MMKRLLVSLLICLTLFSSVPMPDAHASMYVTGGETVLDDISLLMPILEDVLKQKEEIEISKLKNLIKRNKWDYEYTMQAYYNMGNVYKDVDYNRFIAAYATVTEYGRNGKELFSDIPFLEIIAADEYVEEEDIHFGKTEYRCMDPDDLMEYYGYSKDSDAYKAYMHKIEAINSEINKETISQTVFIETPKSVASPETDSSDFLYLIDEAGSEVRKDIITTAMSLLGQVPYQYGGKPDKGGYDRTWWTFNGRTQKGLDCSGFVKWTYMTMGFKKSVTDKLHSTASIVANLPQIDKEQLKPGDIGIMLPKGSEGINHCGIYLGDGYWIHCASSKGTVVINKFGFKYYYSALIDFSGEQMYNQVEYTTISEEELSQLQTEPEPEVIEPEVAEGANESTENVEEQVETVTETEIENEASEEEIITDDDPEEESGEENEEVEEVEEAEETEDTEGGDYEVVENTEEQPVSEEPYEAVATANVSEDDVMLLAKTISHEAHAEGYNGWVAVAEVVVNRKNSSKFPNSIYEVVYQKGQFSNSGQIAGKTPTAEEIEVARQVLSGNLAIFGNTQVLYFRNPRYAGLNASQNVNWGKHQWFTSVGNHAFYLG